jgi:broad specificity phosphatase PhoE
LRSLTLILTRHGETVDNAAGVVQGHRGGELSARGREQARAMAERLRGVPIDAVYSSDLGRAMQTAEILVRGGNRPAVLPEPRLREQDFGDFEGQSLDGMMRHMRERGADFTTFNPPGGEPAESFRKRVLSFLSEVAGKHLEQTVLLVSHNGPVAVLLEELACHAAERAPLSIVPQGEFRIVRLAEDGSAM